MVGTFTRITFLAFFLPIAWQCLRWTSRQDVTLPFLYSRAKLLFLPILTGLVTFSAIVLTDTYYFHGGPWNLTITPLNFLLYNLSPQNVAEHGLHPRWLHAFVNLPMIVGPSLLLLACARVWNMPTKQQEDVNQMVDQSKLLLCGLSEINSNSWTAMILTFFISLAILSIQPHQEPRFLMPFLPLFVIFVGNSNYLLGNSKIFWVGFWVGYSKIQSWVDMLL